jgi:hypothetical protein
MKIEVQELHPDDQLACDQCGRFGAIQLEDRKLCPTCYECSGACCAGEDEPG